jgi:hypothetical protein
LAAAASGRPLRDHELTATGGFGQNARAFSTLETFSALVCLMALQFCAFVCLVTADYATRRCSKYSMMSGEMARSTAHQRAFDAALGIRRCNCCQGKENGGASNNRFHFSLQCEFDGR